MANTRDVMRSRFLPHCLAVALIAGLCLPAAALTLASATWTEMRRMADCVVSVRIASVQAEPTAEPGTHGVRTRVKFSDVKVLEGQPAGSIELLLPGGCLNSRCVRVPGTPSFVPGEAAVLFLRRGDQPGDYHLCGYGLGVLRERDGRIVPDLPVDGGPLASGEELPAFFSRFSAPAQPAPATVEATTPDQPHSWLIIAGIVAALLLAAGFARRKWRGTALFAVACGTLLSCAYVTHPRAATPAPRDGFTYVLDGPKWDLNTPLFERISGGRILWYEGQTSKDLSANDAFTTIAAAFQKWEDVPTSAVAFRKAGVTIDAGSADDLRNTISFLIKPPRSAFDAKTLAITFLLGNPSTNTYSDTDTVFNDRDVQWAVSGGRFSLDVVSLHEFGHILGLGHSSNTADVMYPIAQGLTQLSVSDQAGAAVLYPLNSVVPITAAYACPRLGTAPLTVSFSSEGTTAGTDVPLTVQWDFGDGSPVTSNLNPVHVYTAPGAYTATLTIPGSLAPASQTLIRVLPGTGSPVVKAFQYQASLLGQSRSDRFSTAIDNVDFTNGDTLTLMIGGVSITSQQTSATHQNDFALRNTKAAGAINNGRLAVKYNLQKKELALAVANAALGRSFDFRDPSNAALTGTLTLPFNLLVTHADSTTTLYSTTVTFNFVIKTGKAKVGTIEKAIQGKLQ